MTSDGRVFTYDPLGMMTSASVSGRSFQYLYTADDERIGIVEVTNPSLPQYTWTIRGFGNQLLRTYTGATSSMTWGEDEIWRGGVLLANERPTGTRHYALDHLGSPRSVTSNSGTVLGQQLFQPFGSGGTSDGGALQFTGQERDMDLFGSGTANLPDYFHARYYDVQGRFLSVDPELGDPHSLESWNRYSYVAGNPLTRIDRDGRNWQDFVSAIGPATAATIDDIGYSVAHPALVVMAGFLNDSPSQVALGEAETVAVAVAPEALDSLGSAISKAVVSRVDLAARAAEIQGALPSATQRFTTTAVARVADSDGGARIVVASSERALRPAQRAVLKSREAAINGVGHAEQKIVSAAGANGETVEAVAASRPICPTCANAIRRAGATTASPIKASEVCSALSAACPK